MVAKEDGDWWYCEGERIIGQHNGTATGVRFEEGEDLVSQKSLWEDVRPGGYIPEEHVKDMDADGVDAGLIYPSVGLALFRSVRDSRLLAALFRTYNDWLAEFCLVSPGRLRGIAMIDIDDIGSGVNEMERCARSGLAGAMVSVYPVEDRAYHLPDYGRLWAAAEDLDMPLSLHLATNRPGPSQTFWGPSAQPHAFLCNADHWPRMSLFHMIFSGVFERHPKLRVGVIETELSWVPHFLKQLDYNYTQRAHGQDAYRFRETAPFPATTSTATCFSASRKTIWASGCGTSSAWITCCGARTTPTQRVLSPGAGRSSRKFSPTAPRRRRPRYAAATPHECTDSDRGSVRHP